MNRLQARGIRGRASCRRRTIASTTIRNSRRAATTSTCRTAISAPGRLKDFPPSCQRSPADVGGPTGRAAPKMGEDNDFVYGKLVGLSAAEMAALQEEEVI